MAATPLIEVRAGPAFGTLTASPKASLAKPFCNWALGIRRWIYGDDTEVVPPLVGPKSHSENHGRIPRLCSSSRTTKRKMGRTDERKIMKQPFNFFRIIGAIALLTLAIGCATNGTQTTDLLTAAGFKVVAADTPQKQE